MQTDKKSSAKPIERFETRDVLAAIDALVRAVLAGRDDERALLASIREGRVSLRFGFDSAKAVISIAVKRPNGEIKPLDAIFADDGHPYAGRRVTDVLFELAAQKRAH